MASLVKRLLTALTLSFHFSFAENVQNADVYPKPSSEFSVQRSFSDLFHWGWFESNDGTWHADSDLCILKKTTSKVRFEKLTEWGAALSVSKNLQTSLQRFKNVEVRPLSRPNQWALWARYTYTVSDQPYTAYEVYLSDNDTLLTYTGSSREGEANVCSQQMQKYLYFFAS